MFFPQVRECLDVIQKNQIHDVLLLGTKVYLKICWQFVDVFSFMEATFLKRIEYASSDQFPSDMEMVGVQSESSQTEGKLPDQTVLSRCHPQLPCSCLFVVLV